ncbi:MAG: hypothetical protein IPN70_05405 [Candidatus Moraniibacteriota bacterium]|nr:MAG: hypothetical protein IPN70_05405 [Candidatus Moranbacteria bacterium]
MFEKAFIPSSNSSEKNNQEFFSPSEKIENFLRDHNFNKANQRDVLAITQDSSLLCRSLNFSDIEKLLEEQYKTFRIPTQEEANTCSMSFGEGIRTALQEGFSQDISRGMKFVLSFTSSSVKQSSLQKDSPLWETKPKNSHLFCKIEGHLSLSNIKMITIRFHKDALPFDEQEDLEENELSFLTKHYIKKEAELSEDIQPFSPTIH